MARMSERLELASFFAVQRLRGPLEVCLHLVSIVASSILILNIGAIAYGVGHMNKVANLNAWRWLFILEGLPCVALAVVLFFFMPSYPEKAKWLTTKEMEILQASFGKNIPRG